MRVLLVEDDELVASGICAGLQVMEFVVDHVADIRGAEAALATGHCDALVLDLALPDGDGMDLLGRLRAAENTVPVLILTARDSIADRVSGLEAGADDYLVKPFELAELAARLQALQRRSAGRAHDRIEHEGLVLSPKDKAVTLHGQSVELSRRELQLLRALLDSPTRIFSAEELHSRLYGFDDDVSSNVLNVHIHHLRQKLGPDIVHTVRGLGYRLGKSRS